MQIPVLKISRFPPRPSTYQPYQLQFQLEWTPVREMGPPTEPAWLRDLRDSFAYRSSGRRDINLEKSSAIREALHDFRRSAPGPWRERIEAYAASIGKVDLCPLPINDFLEEYSRNASAHRFSPVLRVHTDITDVLWPFISFNRSGPPPASPGNDLWCLQLALGIAPLAAAPPSQVSEDPGPRLAEVAIATRMTRTNDATADDLVSGMRSLIAAWDPWGLSVGSSGRRQFGLLVDKVDEHERHLNAFEAASLILYQGKTVGTGAEVASCRWPIDISQEQVIKFDLKLLGARRATLVLAGGGDLEVDDEPSTSTRFCSSRAFELGANCIGAPVALEEIDALKFSQAFLHETCTRGAPIGELLRCALRRSLESPGELDLYPFILHGDPAALLPFAARCDMQMHVMKREKSVVCDLASLLEDSPLIPISIVWHDEYGDMDSEFLRRLETGAPAARQPEIWPVSLCAIGRALFDDRYAGGAWNRLWIIQVALYSRGGNRLIVWSRKNPEEQPEPQELRRLAWQDPRVLGFAHNSFEGTLARMCMHWWSRGEARDRLHADRFVSCPLSFKAAALQGTKINEVLFWGADLQPNSLDDPEIDAESVRKALRENRAIDLDAAFEEEKYAERLAARREPLKIPMIFLVVTFSGDGAAITDGSVAAAGRGGAERRPPPPESFFALRELQRSFQGMASHPKAMDLRGGGLVAGEPHYFRSLDVLDLEVMTVFVTEALSLGLWERTGGPVDGEEVRRKLEQHLYLTPEHVQKGERELEKRLPSELMTEGIADVLNRLDQMMWGQGATKHTGAISRGNLIKEIVESIKYLSNLMNADQKHAYGPLLQVDANAAGKLTTEKLARLANVLAPNERENALPRALEEAIQVLRERQGDNDGTA